MTEPGLGGALREALELMVKEWHWYAGKHGLGPARLQYALGVGERALSLSSPIEPNVATTLLRKWRDYAEEMRKGKAWIVSAESRDLLKLQVEMAERFIRDLETL